MIVGPFLRLYNRPVAVGMDKIPSTGAAILAPNHQSMMDSFYLPLMCPRMITFLAKSDYFEGGSLIKNFQRWFFTAVGQVPIDRTSASAAQAALDTGVRVLEQGELLGIYQEGTRSPDGRIYKPKTGLARVALRTGAPVYPIGLIGTKEANPMGSALLRPAKVKVVVGDAIDPHAFVKAKGLAVDDADAPRVLANYIAEQQLQLTGNEYVDCYAAVVKESLAAGNGYPAGTEPNSTH